MTPEERKEYNREYYAKNSVKTNAKLYAKETCQHCGRAVSHQNMFKHMKTELCKRRRSAKEAVEFSKLSSRINEIYNLLQHKKTVEEFEANYDSELNAFTYNASDTDTDSEIESDSD